jgi:hypothetical protein
MMNFDDIISKINSEAINTTLGTKFSLTRIAGVQEIQTTPSLLAAPAG